LDRKGSFHGELEDGLSASTIGFQRISVLADMLHGVRSLMLLADGLVTSPDYTTVHDDVFP